MNIELENRYQRVIRLLERIVAAYDREAWQDGESVDKVISEIRYHLTTDSLEEEMFDRYIWTLLDPDMRLVGVGGKMSMLRLAERYVGLTLKEVVMGRRL